MGRTATLALMVVLWLAVVAWGAQQLGDALDRSFTEAAQRIERRGN